MLFWRALTDFFCEIDGRMEDVCGVLLVLLVVVFGVLMVGLGLFSCVLTEVFVMKSERSGQDLFRQHFETNGLIIYKNS